MQEQVHAAVGTHAWRGFAFALYALPGYRPLPAATTLQLKTSRTPVPLTGGCW